MLGQKCSYRNDIETCKTKRRKQKNRTKVCNLTKKIRAKLPAANADTWWLQ